MTKRPEIGAKMYHVVEHLYYVPGRVAPEREYCVCEAVVQGISARGIIKLLGDKPEGYLTPWYYRPDEIGEKLFYTEAEATAACNRKGATAWLPQTKN